MENNEIKIQGYGDNLTINGIRIGDLSPEEHEKIEMEKGAGNYSPLENIVISQAKDETTLIARMPDPSHVKAYIEQELVDGLCCYSAVNQGQLNETIVNSVIHHLTKERLPTVPRSIRHKYMAAFLLATTAVTKMDRVIPKVAGVEAPELMFKLARRWGYEKKGIPKNKALVVVAEGNFHGRSMFAISASTDPESRINYGPFLPGIEKVPFNDLNAMEEMIKKHHENLAAIILEPIQGEAGVIIPSEDYHKEVRNLCDEYNTLYCLDEVQTGYGRTGENFAHQLFKAKPDLMACGKAAGGGILPISFVSGRDDVIEVLTPGTEGSTFGGYPLACVVGVYAIKVLVEEKLAEKAKEKGKLLMNHLKEIQEEFPEKIKEYRGKGLLTAFEMFDKPELDGHKVSVELSKKGVYAKETHHSTVRIAPALTISEEKIDKIAEAIREVIREL
jgi:ornithine--oxo-acid transaminase